MPVPSKGNGFADTDGTPTYDYCIVYKPHEDTRKAQGKLQAALEEEIPAVRIWDATKGADMEEGIRQSRNVILMLTSDFTTNEAVVSQMRCAFSQGKKIIRVIELLLPYHAPNFDTLVNGCPDKLKSMLGTRATCIEMSYGSGKKETVAQILAASVKNAAGGALLRGQGTSGNVGAKISLGGLVFQRGEDAPIQIFDSSLVRFCALCGVSLPGAGPWTRKWSVAVWIILSICALMCFSRFGTTVGPAFLDYATIIQISVDHPALVLFLFVSYKLVRRSDVEDMVQYHINCKDMVKFLRLKQKIATGLSTLLTVSLVLFGWAGYLPGFFHEYYIANSDGKMVLFGLAHGLIWVIILPIFFGSLFAALLIMFVVQELSYCSVFSTFSLLHQSIGEDTLHTVAADRRELKVTQDDFQNFQQGYLTEWERNRKIQKLGAVPFMVFWLLEFFLMSWSIWSLAQGFNADHDDERVIRLERHWNLLVRLTFFMVHSLWFGAGALIVGFLPFGVNFYGWRMRQLCRKLNISDNKIKADLLAFLKAHDLNMRVYFLRTPLWALPFYALIVSVNIAGYNADAARLFGAYDR